jgi:hypothetical protein
MGGTSEGPYKGLQLPKHNVVDVQALVHQGALLKENHPGGDGTDVRQQYEEYLP